MTRACPLSLRLIGAVVALSIVAAPACRRKAPKRLPPRLVAVIVVDQLRGDELERYRPLWRHGMRQLLAEGRWYTQAYLGYGRTETAAGHATLATGLRPRLHGIIDKQFYDRGLGAVTHVCHGGTDVCGVDNLLQPTLGDRLKQRSPSSRVIAVGAKPRSAMLLGGRERLRPVLMTAMTTLLGLLPIVIQKPSLAGIYYYSMALVIMGGLLISTVLTTILLPTTVCLTEDSLGWVGRGARRVGGWMYRRIRRPGAVVAK